jgi:hypothetical protein
LLLVRERQSLRTALELAWLGFDAWTVIGLRTLKLGAGGRAASLEAQRMMVEKTATMLEVQAVMAMALDDTRLRLIGPSSGNVSGLHQLTLTLGARAAHFSNFSHCASRSPSAIRFAGQRLPYHQNAQTRRARGDRGKHRTNSSLRENCRCSIGAKSRN